MLSKISDLICTNDLRINYTFYKSKVSKSTFAYFLLFWLYVSRFVLIELFHQHKDSCAKKPVFDCALFVL